MELKGKKLLKPDGIPAGEILAQLTDVGLCDQHVKCPGPVVRLQWADGRKRRECLYQLLKQMGWRLSP